MFGAPGALKAIAVGETRAGGRSRTDDLAEAMQPVRSTVDGGVSGSEICRAFADRIIVARLSTRRPESFGATLASEPTRGSRSEWRVRRPVASAP
jgi:hypothetical protein